MGKDTTETTIKVWPPIPEEALNRLGHALGQKGYLVGISVPARRYSATEQWLEYAVTFSGGGAGAGYALTAKNYHQRLKEALALPRAEAFPFVLDNQPGLARPGPN
jgi:hypothetical protein